MKQLVCCDVTSNTQLVGEVDVGSSYPRNPISFGRKMTASAGFLFIPPIGCATLSQSVTIHVGRDGITTIPCIPFDWFMGYVLRYRLSCWWSSWHKKPPLNSDEEFDLKQKIMTLMEILMDVMGYFTNPS